MMSLITATVQYCPGATSNRYKSNGKEASACHYFLEIVIIFLEKAREKILELLQEFKI